MPFIELPQGFQGFADKGCVWHMLMCLTHERRARKNGGVLGVHSMEEFLAKQHQQFHEKLKKLCGNRVEFDKHFIVDWQHIDRKADKEQVRANLGSEQLASVIKFGTLCVEDCERFDMHSKIAIDGKFLNFQWLEYPSMETKILDSVVVRVVVREGKRNVHVVVTAYDLREENIKGQPNEVSYEIW